MRTLNVARQLGQRLGFAFSSPDLVEQALTHRSCGANNNERLEFLGDSILNFVIAEALCQKYPDQDEGVLSRMRAHLVKGKTLAELARQFNLGELLILGPGEMKSGGHRRDSILADSVEALIAAIYLDGGLEVCRERILAWFDQRLKDVSPEQSKDAKTRLQEWLQARKRPLPVYRVTNASGEEHQQYFTVACEIDGISRLFSGDGHNRRTAEQLAADAALKFLQEQL